MTSDTENLGNRIAKGAFWTVAMRMSIRLLGIVSVIVLARILTPEDFGIVAKAAMIQAFLELIIEFGFENYLIKDQSSTRLHYDTVWTLTVLRGTIISIILIVLAYPASLYLKEPELDTIIYYYALVSLINGFVNIGVVDFRKDLAFDLDFRFNLYRKLASFSTTLIVAITWKTYWAFVAGVLVGSLSALVISYVMSPYRPRFSLKKIRSLFRFSKWIFGFGLIKAISTKLDMFLLSRFSTTEAVGLYTVSYEVAGTPSTEIAMPAARAMLPGLAKVNQDPEKFRSLYLSSLSIVLLFAIPAGVGVSAISHSVTLVLLGEIWLNAVPLIQALAIFGVTRAIFSISVAAFVSFNRPDMLAKLSIVDLLLKLIFLPPGIYFFGLLGIAWGVLISSAIHMFVTLFMQNRLGMLSMSELWGQSWRIILSSILMYIGIHTMQTHIEIDLLMHSAPIITMLFEIFFGAFIFIACLSIFLLTGSSNERPEKRIFNIAAAKFYCFARKIHR